MDGLAKYHKQQGGSLHRLPYVDKKPLDLYRLKKAVESRGGFDQVCKLKKWAEIGRDLGYSGKIMSSLSTSLKNSYQRWLCPYEEYLRLAKPGVHQQLEQEYGGPLTPSPAPTPSKRSNINTPVNAKIASPIRAASDLLREKLDSAELDSSHDVSMDDIPAAPAKLGPPILSPIIRNGFAAVNAGSIRVNGSSASGRIRGLSAELKAEPTAEPPKVVFELPILDSSGSLATKRQRSTDESQNGCSIDVATEQQKDGDNSNRRSKRLRKDPVPTVAGSHMTVFRPSIPRVTRDGCVSNVKKCQTCGGVDSRSGDALLVCESCDNAYHGSCLDPPTRHKSDVDWNCPRCLVGDGQFGFEEGGLYSLKQFQQKANDFKQGYFEQKMPFDHTLKCHRPVTEEDIENEFWRLVADLEETVEVEYGADIHCTTHGSGFPTAEKQATNSYSTDPWNLNMLPFHQDSLFKHIKTDISGMTVPWVYVGMVFSTFCWHNEDHYAYSANYQHLGATKTWYGIPGEDAEKFEAAMRDAVPELFETQPDLLFQLVTLLTPEQLSKAGVRVYALDQRAGQFVITFPQAYHAGFNHGFNFNEAVNFAPSDWEPFGMASVHRLQAFRRQPCFSHDELLYTAAEGGNATGGLTIQTAKWLAPALEDINQRERRQRDEFIEKHIGAQPHQCLLKGNEEPGCSMLFRIDDSEVQNEEEQCCSYCNAFTYLSRFRCHVNDIVLCIHHAGSHPCCSQTETERLSGDGKHSLIYRKSLAVMAETHQKVAERAEAPDMWQKKYDNILDEESKPSLKALRALLHEGERIPYDIPSVLVLKEFVDRCNDWVDEATTYIVRKQQNRRKNEKAWQSGLRKSTGAQPTDQKEQEMRNVSNIGRLLTEAEHIGFDSPEIFQLQERAAAIDNFRASAVKALEHASAMSMQSIEELLEEGRGFNVDIPELDRLSEVLEQVRWNDRARSWRGTVMSLAEVKELVDEGKKLGIPSYNDHSTFFTEQMLAGEAWEVKAKELVHAEFVHYPQLEALSRQVKTNGLPVSPDTFAAVDAILHKQREAHRQILDITERCRDADYHKRPRYAEVIEISKQLEDLNSKPNGTVELENEKKRHEDWMRRGKRLFGKSNAPLHILKNHLLYVLERNSDCFDVEHDTPRLPGEPVSRQASPEDGDGRWSDPRSRQVFCICRKVEAGMMIECELCHEW